MESFVRNFIRSSLVWLGLGVLMGIGMAFWPMEHLVYRPAHAHANLLGFVSMMIFGVAYHVIPRFAGAPLTSRRLPAVHLWAANLGLAGMVGGFLLRPWLWAAGDAVLRVGAGLTAVGTFLFIGVIWTTLGSAEAPVRIARTAPPAPLERRPAQPLEGRAG